MKEGQLLKNIIENQSLPITEICKRSAISRTKLYGLYKEDIIDDYYKRKLKNAGIEITQNVHNVNTLMNTEQIVREMELLKKEFDLLKRETELTLRQIKLTEMSKSK